jgi:hypothetical protein
MYKVYCNQRGETKLYFLEKQVVDLIKEWYLFAEYLSKFGREDITVYRGVKNMDINIDHIQPIPFSTCLQYSSSLDWIIPNNSHSFIMSIYVSRKNLYTFIGNQAEGNEVILPAGNLFFLKKVKIKDTNMVYYKFKQYSNAQFISTMNNCKI